MAPVCARATGTRTSRCQSGGQPVVMSFQLRTYRGAQTAADCPGRTVREVTSAACGSASNKSDESEARLPLGEDRHGSVRQVEAAFLHDPR
jgi:hypothetical protein